jgi:4-hydroxy-2-oxoheptanedioate aldolase
VTFDPAWKTRANRFKTLIAAGEPAVAMWATLPWPPIMEIAGACGFDVAFVDLEHTTIGLDMAEHMIVAAQLAKVSPMVRVPAIDHAEVTRLLDAGAEGIIFPRVNTAEEARHAWKSLRYRPEGDRGWGGSHHRRGLWQGPTVSVASSGSAGRGVLSAESPADHGVYSSEYVEKSVSDVVSMLLIETGEGIANLDEILDAGKPDLVGFGIGDYSVEVNFDPEACRKAALTVYEACRRRGIGVPISPGDSSMPFYPGCFAIAAIDALVLSAGLERAIDGVREAPARAASNAKPA